MIRSKRNRSAQWQGETVTKTPPIACLHCKEVRAIYRKGLCSHCYKRKPGVKDQYPNKPKVIPTNGGRKPRDWGDKACKHCVVRRSTQARGLCHVCYNDDAIRERYPTRIDMRRVCRCCRRPGVGIAGKRGLCWNCYLTPGVFEQFESKYKRRGDPDFFGRAKLPEPTQTPPGTLARMLVYQERAARGESIFHPQDAGYAENSNDVLTLRGETRERQQRLMSEMLQLAANQADVREEDA